MSWFCKVASVTGEGHRCQVYDVSLSGDMPLAVGLLHL